MKLEEALKKVREEDLSKQELENYHLALSGLLADMKIEVASLEKAKAIFMSKKEAGQSVADRKVDWGGTTDGQRLIEMKGKVSATTTMVGSLKTRLYSVY